MSPAVPCYSHMKRFPIILLLFVLGRLAAVAAGSDGPYVVQEADGAWVARSVRDADTRQVAEEKVTIGQTITVPAVGAVPAFSVVLRDTPAVASETIITVPDAPLFIVADTHGEFEILVALLRKQGIIDERLKWHFGHGHLVFLGDVFDRGPNQTEIFWLIYELEAEAAQAGGGVHLVLGNHEVMNLSSDLRYENLKYLKTADVLQVKLYSDLWANNTLLGRWLRTKPAVLRINDLLCMHGGISRALLEAKLALPRINDTVCGILNQLPAACDADRETTKLVSGKLGPLWYRGYFPEMKDFPTATTEDVKQTLEFYRAKTIFVGHTIVEHVTPLYDGKVIAVQVYPHKDETTGAMVLEAVRINHGEILCAKIDGTTTPLR